MPRCNNMDLGPPLRKSKYLAVLRKYPALSRHLASFLGNAIVSPAMVQRKKSGAAGMNLLTNP
jgi:hypothetical protein